MHFRHFLLRFSRRRPSRNDGGFTLIELLVVLVILGLLASIVAPRILGQLSGAKTKAAAVQIKNIKAALEIYLLDVGAYPTTAQGLDALLVEPSDAPSWNGPYLNEQSLPLDPWGEGYRYRSPGEHAAYDLFSLGADKQEGHTARMDKPGRGRLPMTMSAFSRMSSQPHRRSMSRCR